MGRLELSILGKLIGAVEVITYLNATEHKRFTTIKLCGSVSKPTDFFVVPFLRFFPND